MDTRSRATYGLSRSRSATDVYRSSLNVSIENRLTSSFTSTWSPSKHRSLATPRTSLTLPKKCTYLTDDIRKEYELGYEAAAPVAPQSSFVKKLVATLERRHRDLKDFRTARSPQKEASKLTPPSKGTTKTRIISRSPNGLDSLEEGVERDRVPPPLPAKGVSHLKVTAQRALRRFTSLLTGWKNPKKLPAMKGTRNYYADRESLSDELGAFRREIVPKLMHKSPLSADAKDQKLCEAEQRQFSELIRSQLLMDNNEEGGSLASSHATVRRAYSIRTGKALHEPSSSSSHYRIPRCQLRKEETRHFSSPPKEGIFRTPTVKKPSQRMAPAVPPPLPPLPPRQAVELPSTFRETEKLVSLDSEFASVQLRRHRRPDPVIYDVPNSRPVSSVSSSISSGRPCTPQYENLTKVFIDKDKRLNLTEFTTF